MSEATVEEFRRKPPAPLAPRPLNLPAREEIKQAIQQEIARLAQEGPTAEEMEKLRNNLLNDAVRGRQSTMYCAQRLAEFTLYDGDPNLFNTELENYLAVTPAEIKRAAARYLATEDYALMEVIPAPEEAATAAEPIHAPAAEQPGAPPPQVPPRPRVEPPPPTQEPDTPLADAEPQAERPAQPADAPQ